MHSVLLWETKNSIVSFVLESDKMLERLADIALIELTYLAVDPQYQKQGAGSLIVEWGLRRCDEEGCPAYLESTMDAVGFYEKKGFKAVGKLAMDIGGILRDGEHGVGDQIYRELGMVYRPEGKAKSHGEGQM